MIPAGPETDERVAVCTTRTEDGYYAHIDALQATLEWLKTAPLSSGIGTLEDIVTRSLERKVDRKDDAALKAAQGEMSCLVCGKSGLHDPEKALVKEMICLACAVWAFSAMWFAEFKQNFKPTATWALAV